MTPAPPRITEAMIDQRVMLEKGMRFIPPVTLSLILINSGVFVWQLAVGALKSTEALVKWGAMDSGKVLAGEWWRVGFANFLHGDIDHLLGNMAALYIVGMASEHLFGPWNTLLTYAITGVVAMTSSLLLSVPTVGASGAVFGLTAAVGTCVYRHRERFHARDYRVGLVLIIWAIYAVITAAIQPWINNLAHATGLIAGVLVSHFQPVRILRK